VILGREASGGGLKVSNVGGWHSAPDLQAWPDEPVRSLVERIRTALGKVGAQGSRIQAWANVMRKGSFHLAHRHGESAWSGVYYVDPGDGPGGRIQFARGRVTRTILPRVGLILVFPGDLLHSVEPYEGARPRISVAFNLLPWRGTGPEPAAARLLGCRGERPE
jgi:hypothetical protein